MIDNFMRKPSRVLSMILINADDLGKSHSRNLAIRQAMNCGWIDRASLIVNSEWTDEAVKMFRGGGGICFHLNLGEGTPLTEGMKSTFLCNAEGKFKRMNNPKQHLKMAIRGDVRNLIRQEIEVQMAKFRDCGFKSTHVDSHFFTHAELDVALELVSAMKRFGFKTIRALSGHFVDIKLHSARWRVRLYYKYVKRLYEKAGLVFDAWSGCAREYLNAGPIAGEVEIYVHPDTINGEFVDTVYSYRGETRLMSLVRNDVMSMSAT